MENKRSKIGLIIIFIIIIIVSVFTIYKLNKNHEKKLYNVLYNKIEYKAKRCYLEKNCEEKFKLKDLYDKKYLDIMYDPISKEALDENINITIKKDKVIIKK